jgi:exodeoxyribonuclease V alpha subunit
MTRPTDPAREASAEVVVEDVLYRSPDGRYAVVRAHRASKPDGEGLVAVGDLGQVAIGETLRLRGRFAVHPVYGERFRVESFTPVVPETRDGIARYLGSGLVPGIGKAMAERLVARFGERTLEVIATQSQKLREVPGIGAKRAADIADAVRSRRVEAELLSFLHGLGLGPAAARRILRRFGGDAAREVRENPYLVAERVPGIGFRTADRIAAALGIGRDDPRRAAGAVLHLLAKGADEGHVYATLAELERGAEGLDVPAARLPQAIAELALEGLLVDDEGRLYAPTLYEAERATAKRLAALARPRTLPAGWERAIAGARDDSLSEDQWRAVGASLEAGLMVLTGGPGTGKTTAVRALLGAHRALGRRILLCAPTGRAAKRLTETAGVEAKTIHRLLEWNPATGRFKRDAETPLDAETVLVDEASMLDLWLAKRLLEAIPERSNLVLVGDVDQLPPVGAGQVLRELLASGVGRAVRLTRIFRQAEASAIVLGAHRILEGDLPEPTPAGQKGAGDLFFVAREEPAPTVEALLGLLRRVGPAYGLDPRWDVQVLSPMRRGPLGVDALNLLLQAELNPGSRPEGDPPKDAARTSALRAGDKVMQLQNDYDRDVYNGDVGEVAHVEGGITYVRFDGREVQYPADDLDALGLAYASTVHKVQGSEFPAVIVVMHGAHHLLLSRALLYTAVTRGKRLVVLLGDPKAFARAARNAETTAARSHLRARLVEEAAALD